MKAAGGTPTTTYEVAMKLLVSMTIGAVMALNTAVWAAPAVSEPTAVGLWEQVDEKTPYPLPVSLAIGDKVLIEATGAYTATYSSVGFNGYPPLRQYVI